MLDLLLLAQKQFDLIRQTSQVCQHSSECLLINGSTHLGELHSQHVKCGQLCTVSLGRCNGNLGTCPGVHNTVRFSGNGAAHYVHDTQYLEALCLRFPKSCQRICSLTGLTDDDDHVALLQDGITITEFAGHVHLYRNSCQTFDDIFRGNTGVICGAAGHNMDLGDLLNLLIAHIQFFDDDIIILDTGRNGIVDRLRLLVDLLQHEMLIAAFFRSIGIPVDRHRFFGDLFFVH